MSGAYDAEIIALAQRIVQASPSGRSTVYEILIELPAALRQTVSQRVLVSALTASGHFLIDGKYVALAPGADVSDDAKKSACARMRDVLHRLGGISLVSILEQALEPGLVQAVTRTHASFGNFAADQRDVFVVRSCARARARSVCGVKRPCADACVRMLARCRWTAMSFVWRTRLRC